MPSFIEQHSFSINAVSILRWNFKTILCSVCDGGSSIPWEHASSPQEKQIYCTNNISISYVVIFFKKCKLFIFKSFSSWSSVNWWNMRKQCVKRNGIFGIHTIQTQASDKCICLYVGACQKGPAEGTARSSGESGSAAPLWVHSLLRVGEQLWGHRCCVHPYPHLHAECPMHSDPFVQCPTHTVPHAHSAPYSKSLSQAPI